ncbi:HNH endonuclease, partial [Candidatus Sumerlaeota bacterium]|nr:HNH endonuclease [Candidatus Sumerlaeota bacterium]
MTMKINRPVLVLNRHLLAVHICTVKRAISLVYQELAHIVTEDYQTHSFESWRELSQYAEAHAEMIRTPQFQIRVPQVIVLGRYQNSPPRTVRFNRRNIYMRDHYQCQYCGCHPDRDDMTIDHIIPRSRGGKSTWENVTLACTNCNTRKGDRLPAECGMHPLTQPKRPSWMATLRVI